MLTSSRRALAALFVIFLGCGYPSFGFVPDESLVGEDTGAVVPDDVGADSAVVDSGVDTADAAKIDVSDGTSDGTSDVADADAGCAAPDGLDPCAKIPKLKAAKQTLDGAPDEFCGLPTNTFVIASATHAFPYPVPSGVDTVLTTRVAWSTTALHVHVHVVQASIFTPAVGEELWHGDAVEIFASGFSKLNGSYAAGSDTGAEQFIVVPASGSKPARALLYLGEVIVGDVDPARWASRTNPDGYDVEMLIPWTDLHGTPASGLTIGFDLAVDVRQTSTGPTPLVQALYALRNPIPTTCTRGEAHPSCDDRAWCTPTLE